MFFLNFYESLNPYYPLKSLKIVVGRLLFRLLHTTYGKTDSGFASRSVDFWFQSPDDDV